MKKCVRVALFLPLLALFIGPSPAQTSGRPSAPRPEADKLASLLLANSFREADRLAASLLADPSIDAPTRALCGLAVLKAGRIEEAEALFNNALSRSPDNPEAHLGLGRIARIRDDRDSAITHFKLAVPSAGFYGEALRQLWQTAWDRGRVDDLFEIRKLAEERYGRESRPLSSWFANGLGQIQGLAGKRLFEMEGSFEHLRIPLVTAGPHVRIRMISLKLNGKGEYLFDIDSAATDFLLLSPLLAEELGLTLTGSAAASGVGTATAAVRFAVLDKVELGAVAFRNVPVRVSDIHPFRGLKKGLLGTGLLKRFNVTIDVEAKAMDLFPLDRPELLAANIDRAAVAADVPLYLFDATTVEASLGGAPPALYILDSAAATNLVDGAFFLEHIRPKLDPARIVPWGIRGAQGAQSVNMVNGLTIDLGPLAFEGQQVCEFPMEELNDIGGRYAAGLVGNPLLWPYRVHMDFRNGRLILEKYPKS